jgi:hypothetical protein
MFGVTTITYYKTFNISYVNLATQAIPAKEMLAYDKGSFFKFIG